MIVSSSAIEHDRSCREHHLGAQARLARQRDRAAELVADERPHDREPRALRRSPFARAVVGDRERRRRRSARASSIRTVPPPCSSAFWKSSLKTSASAVARSPASDTGSSSASTVLARDEPLDEHRAQPLDQLGEVDVVLAVLGQHLVHGRDREDPVDRVRRAPSAGRRSAARACSRSSEATVWRLFLTRWWISWASTPRITARPCSSATAAWCAIASSSCRSSSEKGVSRSQTSSPI